jgi:hypothetical protein
MLTIEWGQVLRWEVRSSVSVPDFGLGCKLRRCGRSARGACRPAYAARILRATFVRFRAAKPCR